MQVIVGDYYAEELETPTTASKGFGNPLKFFNILSQDVYLPFLSSAGTVRAWPDTLSKEVLNNLHTMQGAYIGEKCHSSRARGLTLVACLLGTSNRRAGAGEGGGQLHTER